MARLLIIYNINIFIYVPDVPRLAKVYNLVQRFYVIGCATLKTCKIIKVIRIDPLYALNLGTSGTICRFSLNHAGLLCTKTKQHVEHCGTCLEQTVIEDILNDADPSHACVSR